MLTEHFDKITAVFEPAAVGDFSDLKGGVIQQGKSIFQPERSQIRRETDTEFPLKKSAQIGWADPEMLSCLFQRNIGSIVLRQKKFGLLNQLRVAELLRFRNLCLIRIDHRAVEEQEQRMKLHVQIFHADLLFAPEVIQKIQSAAGFGTGQKIKSVQFNTCHC